MKTREYESTRERERKANCLPCFQFSSTGDKTETPKEAVTKIANDGG